MRILPALDPLSEFFWTSGRDGRLRFLRCQQCRYYVHPPSPRCPRCLAVGLEAEAVSGRGWVYSYALIPDDAGAVSVAAWIVFPEQDDLRLTARLIGLAPAEIRFGMEVAVDFELHDDIYLPVFAAVAGVDDGPELA